MAGLLTSGMRFVLNQKVGLFPLSVEPSEFFLCLTRLCLCLCLSLTRPPCLDSDPKICPAMDHAALVHVNSMLETIPVRTEVDDYIGIDYSLTNDPVVTSRSLDMNFRVRAFTF